MFEWIKDTALGKKMKEWSEVWQPAYNDISGWKQIEDIGKFSKKTIKEWQEAWDTVPADLQKKIYNIFLKLKKVIAPAVLLAITEKYFELIGKDKK